MIRNRKNKILMLLLPVLATAVAWRAFHPYDQGAVKALKYRGDAATVVTNVHEVAVTEVETGVALGRFLSPPAHSGGALRDPFHVKKKPPPVREKVAVEEPPSEKVPPPVEDPLVKVREELERFKVFGRYESAGVKSVFLARGKQLLIVRSGDRIDGKYLVEEVGEDAIRLRVRGLEETVHIDMSRF